METAEAVRLVRLRICNHQRGIYCRAIMWDAILDVVTTESVEPVLNSLPAEEQNYLREQYADWPPSLWSLRPPEVYARCDAIAQWCQAKGGG